MKRRYVSLDFTVLIACSLDYLLSNNHVNSILTHPFDFKNEECLAYYVSFLKTLSFKLNPNTVHFFFNEVRRRATFSTCFSQPTSFPSSRRPSNSLITPSQWLESRCERSL